MTFPSANCSIPAVAKVDPAIFDDHVGQYQLTPELVITVTREGEKLMGQVTGQAKKMEMLPESETVFFVKGESGRTIFVRDDKGKVTHVIDRQQDGQELKLQKIK